MTIPFETSERDRQSSDRTWEALEVNTEVDISRQLWSHLVTKGAIRDPSAFPEPCPRMSFVWGEENVAFLRARSDARAAQRRAPSRALDRPRRGRTLHPMAEPPSDGAPCAHQSVVDVPMRARGGRGRFREHAVCAHASATTPQLRM
jgi:Malate:quinone oxidoreductase (Mqo)